jgi:twinkle protein
MMDGKTTIEEINAMHSRGFRERNIDKQVCEHFGVKVSYNTAGEIDAHYYPYSEGGFKCRRLPKSFSWVGPSGGLFGKDKFNGGGKRLVITEGEIDALTVSQAYFDKYKTFYPVVSIPASTMVAELIKDRAWVRSFGEVVLCFDNDKSGEEATSKALHIIGIDKVKLAKLSAKDPSEMFIKDGGDAIMRCIWDATAWSPAGIIPKEEIWKAIVERSKIESIPYPECLRGINSKVNGMRQGEIALFISGTGSGKSTVTREIGLHILDIAPKEDKLGIISLEESPAETGTKFASMAINRNPAFAEIDEADLKVGFDKVFGEDRVVLLDHQGAIKDASIVDQLEYMCLVGCKYIIVDHITILVSEGADGLTGNEAIDKIMNDLLRLVKKHNVWVGLVSHLRKSAVGGTSFEQGKMPQLDDIRGSGSIKQISFDIIAFARNMVAEDERVRNKIMMSVLKSRTVGLTGPVQGATYTHSTGRLHATPAEEFEIIG